MDRRRNRREPATVKASRKAPPKCTAPALEPEAAPALPAKRPDRSPPAPPLELPADAREEWAAVVPTLYGLGVLSQLDRGSMAAYCCALARFRRAERQIPATGGDVVMVNGKPEPNPWLRVQAIAAKQLETFGRELGLTPGAPIRRR